MAVFLCIGSINVDCYYQFDGDDAPAVSATDHELWIPREHTRCLGGKGYNQAVALKRANAGNTVQMAGAVGERALLVELDSAGLDSSKVLCRPDTPTGHVNIYQRGTHSHVVLWHGANKSITGDDVAAWITGEVSWVVLQNEVGEEALKTALDVAKRQRRRVCFNSAPTQVADRGFWVETVAPAVEVLLVNQAEALQLHAILQLQASAETSVVTANLKKALAVPLVIVTCGADGVYYVHNDGPAKLVPAEPITAVVDTTGAGDTFTGYFLDEYARSGDVHAAVRIGVEAAAWCVQRRGTSVSIPHRRQLR